MNKKYFRLRSCHCKISGICRQIHTNNLPVGKVLDDDVKRRGTLLGVALRYDRGRCDQIVPRDSSKRRLRPQTQAMVGNYKPSRFQLPKYTFNDFWLIVYIFYCEVHLARCFDVKLVNSYLLHIVVHIKCNCNLQILKLQYLLHRMFVRYVWYHFEFYYHLRYWC